MPDKDEIIAGARSAARKAFGDLPERLNATMRDYTRSVAQTIVDSADEAVANIYDGENLDTLKTTTNQIDLDLTELAAIAEAVGDSAGKKPQFAVLYRMWSPRDDARVAIIDLFCQWFSNEASELKDKAARWLENDLNKCPLETEDIRFIARTYLRQTGQTLGLREPVAIDEIGSRAKSLTFLERIGTPGQPARIHASPGSEPGREMAALLFGRQVGESQYWPGWRDSVANHISQNRLFDNSWNSIASDFEYLRLDALAPAFSVSLARQFSVRLSWQITRTMVTATPPERNFLTAILRSRIIPMLFFSAIISGVISALFWTSFQLHDSQHTHLVGTGLLFLILFLLSFCGQTSWLAFKRWQERFEQCVQHITDEVETKVLDAARVAWAETASTIDVPLARQVVGQVTLVKKRPLDYVLEGELSIPEDTGRATEKAISLHSERSVLPGTVISQPLGRPPEPQPETDGAGKPTLASLAAVVAGHGATIFTVIGGITGAVMGGPIGCIPGAIIGMILGSLVGSALIYLLIAGVSAGVGAILGGAWHQGAGTNIGEYIGVTAGVILIIHATYFSRLPSKVFLAKLAAGLVIGFFAIALLSRLVPLPSSAPNEGGTAAPPPPTSPDMSSENSQAVPTGAPNNSGDISPSDSAAPAAVPPDTGMESSAGMDSRPDDTNGGGSETSGNDPTSADSPRDIPTIAQPQQAGSTSEDHPDPATAFAPIGSGLNDAPLPMETLETQQITADDLASLSLYALSISYNQIYAIHGYVFKRAWLRAYFGSQAWYQPNSRWIGTGLTPLEKQNLTTIRSYERVRFGY